IDEIDAIGRARGKNMVMSNDERENTLNQLLVEMDGFDSTTGIIVIAATNRPDILDNALLRPGRFDRQVVIDRPDIKGREQILNVHVKGKPLAKGVELKRLAKATPGFTGADLENMVNEAALAAARHRKETIEMDDLEDAIDKVVVGPEKRSKVIKEKDKEITAYHEIGHALMQIMHPGQYKFRKVTIIPRGMALGISWAMPEDDNTHVSRQQLFNEIASLLGGRVAEKLIFDQIWTGASSDIDKATELARKIVTVWGMSDELGPIKYGQQNEHVFLGRDFGTDRDYSEAIAAKIDDEIKKIIDTQYDLAYKTLGENRDIMDALVKDLLERETLEDKDVFKIMDRILEERGEAPKYAINLSDDEDDEESSSGSPETVAAGSEAASSDNASTAD
ncbi:MAG: AAA family ATPase, partial [Cyanobacteria bacterium HKST-UBA05]|nr:AAA family ATPase [Cyanobacteria bacterium HKST-UBA05]